VGTSIIGDAIFAYKKENGVPIHRHARVPVGVLFENFAAGASLDEILENFPSPRREQAIEAIREATTIIEQSAIPSSSPLFDEDRAG
jgi:uncharacterized protein (DUF433 family)